MNKEIVYEELDNVRQEIEENSDGERNFLEGWEKALEWVIRQIDKESEGECDKCANSYELSSRDNRCGDCGNCGNCCTHKAEEGK